MNIVIFHSQVIILIYSRSFWTPILWQDLFFRLKKKVVRNTNTDSDPADSKPVWLQANNTPDILLDTVNYKWPTPSIGKNPISD